MIGLGSRPALALILALRFYALPRISPAPWLLAYEISRRLMSESADSCPPQLQRHP